MMPVHVDPICSLLGLPVFHIPTNLIVLIDQLEWFFFRTMKARTKTNFRPFGSTRAMGLASSWKTRPSSTPFKSVPPSGFRSRTLISMRRTRTRCTGVMPSWILSDGSARARTSVRYSTGTTVTSASTTPRKLFRTVRGRSLDKDLGLSTNKTSKYTSGKFQVGLVN